MLKWITRYDSTFLHFSKFPDPVSNAKGSMVDMINRNKKTTFQACPVETRSVLYVRRTNGNNILKNWDPSHKHKSVTKTRDQLEPGSFFPLLPSGWWDERPWERRCLRCRFIAGIMSLGDDNSVLRFLGRFGQWVNAWRDFATMELNHCFDWSPA